MRTFARHKLALPSVKAQHRAPSTLICMLAIWNSLFVPGTVYAQINVVCTEAALLWIPSETSGEKAIVKWNRATRFEIFSNKDSPAVAPVKRQLEFIARQSGLDIGSASESSLDLAIVLAPDIAEVAPKVRGYVEGWLSEVTPDGRTRIDPDQWVRTYQNTRPKCSGLNLIKNGRIERAFILMQEDQHVDCFTVGLGELFGLINIRRYYLEGSRYFSSGHVASAFRALYSQAIKAGMSSSDAKAKLGEVCKQH